MVRYCVYTNNNSNNNNNNNNKHPYLTQVTNKSL